MSGSPDYTLTPNLGLFLPNYDMDDGTWGFHLNQNAQILDAAFGGAGAFLPLGGGTVTGLTTFNAGLTVHGVFTLDHTAAATLAAALANIYTGTIAIAPPYVNQIFQRDTRTGGQFNKGAGNILLTITLSQPAAVIEHRLRDNAIPANTIQDWTNSVPPLAAGSQAVALTAPAGLYKYIVDIRANHDNASVASTTRAVMVGELIGFAGQSLAEDMVTNIASGDTSTVAGNGLTVSPWNFVFASFASNSGAYPPVADGPDAVYPPNTFLAPGGGGYPSTFAAELCNRLITAAGVPCAMIGYAVGGSGIDSWLPGYAGVNSGHWTKLVQIITMAGGKFGTFIWDQGHYETKNGNTSSNYYSQLQLLENNVDAAFPQANYQSIVATIPGIGNYGSGPAAIEMVRNTAKQYAAATPLTAYVDGYDATLWSDLVHPSQAGNIPYADHFYRAIMQQWGIRTYGDKGPVITGGSRIYGSKNIVLAVTQTNGGTAWLSVGTPANQFAVYLPGTTTSPIALDGAAPINLTNPAQITLQLAATPTEPQAYDVWYRLPPDTSANVASGIYDNVVDISDGLTLGRQLWDTAAAISIPAPSYPITVNTPAPASPNTTFTVSGTYSIGTPTALDYSINGGTSWTAAASPTIAGGNYSFSLTGGVPYGAFTVMVRDHNATTNFGTSAAFTVAYSPPSLASNPGTPLLVLDASVPGTLWADTARTVPLQNGGALASWSDSSGLGNHFVQTTTALRPLYQTNAKNGLPGIRFTGSLGQYLSLIAGGNLIANLMNGVYFGHIIFTPASLPAVAADVFYTGYSGGTTTNFVRLGEFRAAGTTYHARANTGAVFGAIVNASAVANTLSKLVARFDGTTMYAQVNAITEVTTGYSGTQAAFDQCFLGIFGQTNTLQFPFDGWIHEIRIYGAFGSAQNKTDAQTYATSKWGS